MSEASWETGCRVNKGTVGTDSTLNIYFDYRDNYVIGYFSMMGVNPEDILILVLKFF